MEDIQNQIVVALTKPPWRGRSMRAETKVQAALALLGVPAIFWFWKADAKWPNPFALQRTQGEATKRT